VRSSGALVYRCREARSVRASTERIPKLRGREIPPGLPQDGEEKDDGQDGEAEEDDIEWSAFKGR